jgi:hypothetical protein
LRRSFARVAETLEARLTTNGHEIGEGDRQDVSWLNTSAKELRAVIHGGEYGPDEQRG